MVIDTKTMKVQRRTPEQVNAILNQIKWCFIPYDRNLLSYSLNLTHILEIQQ